MITVRITRARERGLVAHYGGKPDGMHIELMNGGINIKESYISRIEIETGDLIFEQAEPEPEVIEEVIAIKPKPPIKKKPISKHLFKKKPNKSKK